MATTSRSRPGVLGEISPGNIQNIRPSIDSLTRELNNFHIYDGEKENIHQQPAAVQGAISTAEATTQTPGAGGLDLCDGKKDISASQDFDLNNPLALASQQLSSNQAQLSKHQEGQFEWLLSIPVSGSVKGRKPLGDSQDDTELPQSERKLFFGCNLVQRRTQSGGALDNDKSANMYTLLATRIDSEEDLTFCESMGSEELEFYRRDMAETRFEEPYMAGNTDTALDRDHLFVRQPSRPLSRIEDSVEALDRLEEELDAVAEVTHVERVVSAGGTALRAGTSAKTTPLKRTTSVRVGTNSTTGKTLQRGSSVRKAISVSDGATVAADTASTSTRKAVPRPTSLLPPKPPARSSKAPTVPAFELPGEAVARRLKEQRDARRSHQISSEEAAAIAAAYSPAKPHVKSTKPPTRSTFELPGEAISRKKREDREAKLRAQEEEERKRREFKARPIRNSMAPGSAPRENLASLARQNKQRQTDSSVDSTSTTITPSAAANRSKRNSLAFLSTSATTTPRSTTQHQQHHTLPTRGRNPVNTTTSPQAGTGTAPATVSRGTSTSTGSIHSSASSKRSNTTVVSAQEAAQQKLRGREVFLRDNSSFTAQRELERREREQAAKVARQEAAERSRLLGREWKERQKGLPNGGGKGVKA